MKQYIIRLLFKVDASGLKKQLQSISKEAARVGAAMAKSMNGAFKTVAKEGGKSSKQVVKSLDNIDRKSKTSSKNIKTNFKKVDDQMDGLVSKARQLAVGLVSVFAGQKLVSGIRTSVDNFAKLEIGLAKLQAAANSFGADFKTIRDDLIAIRKEGVLSFETLNYVARQLVTPAIGVASDEVGNFIKALRNIAAVEGIYEDLDFSITSFVRGLQTGTAELLENLSPRIRAFIKNEAGGFAAVQKSQAGRQKLFNELLRSGNQLQGAYEELLDTTTFKTKELNVASKELSETLGQGLAPAYNLLVDVLTEGTKSMTAFLESMTIAERATNLLAGAVSVLLGGLLGFAGGAAGGGPIGAIAGGLGGIAAGASLAFGEIGKGIQDFIRSKQKLSDITTELSDIQVQIQKLNSEDAIDNAEEINTLKEQELIIQTEILNRIKNQDGTVDRLKIAYRNLNKEQLQGLQKRTRLERSIAARTALSNPLLRGRANQSGIGEIVALGGRTDGLITNKGKKDTTGISAVGSVRAFLREASGTGGVGAKLLDPITKLRNQALKDLESNNKTVKAQAKRFLDLVEQTYQLQLASVVSPATSNPITNRRRPDGGATFGRPGGNSGAMLGNILPPGVTFAGRQEIRQQEVEGIDSTLSFAKANLIAANKEKLEADLKELKIKKATKEELDEARAKHQEYKKSIEEETDSTVKALRANAELQKQYILQIQAVDDLTSVFDKITSSIAKLKKGGVDAVKGLGSLTKSIGEFLPKKIGMQFGVAGSAIGLVGSLGGLFNELLSNGAEERLLKEQEKHRAILEQSENHLKSLASISAERQKSEKAIVDRNIDTATRQAERDKILLESQFEGEELRKEQLKVDQQLNNEIARLLTLRGQDLGLNFGAEGSQPTTREQVSTTIANQEEINRIRKQFEEEMTSIDLAFSKNPAFFTTVRENALRDARSRIGSLLTDEQRSVLETVTGSTGSRKGLEIFFQAFESDFEKQTDSLNEQLDILNQLFDLETSNFGIQNDLLKEVAENTSLQQVQPRGFGAVDVSRGGLAFGRDFIPTAASLISSVGIPAQIGNLSVAAEANKTMDQKMLDSLQNQLIELKAQTNLLAQLTNTDARIVIANAQTAVKATGF